MTEYALTDADGTVRWRGTIDPPPGGGSSAVACAVSGPTLDASGSGGYFVWDTIYDNVYDGNQIADFPAGMGLSALGAGTDTLTATEPGVWALTIDRLVIPQDATWNGTALFGNCPLTPIFDLGVDASAARVLNPSGTFNLPSGGGFSIGVFPQTPSTASPFNCSIASMCVVRVG